MAKSSDWFPGPRTEIIEMCRTRIEYVNVIGNESEWGANTLDFTFKNSGIKGTYRTHLYSKFAGIIDLDINMSIKNFGSAAKLVLHSHPTVNS
jgi:hypothetical protein